MLDVLAVALPLAVIFGILGRLFWPGYFSQDSVQQLTQAIGLAPLEDAHPVSMALLMRFFTDTDSGFLGYFAFQLSLVVILVCAVTMIAFRWLLPPLPRFRRGSMSAFAVAIALLPPSGLLNLVVWKDVPATWLLTTQAFAVAAFAQAMIDRLYTLRTFSFLLIVALLSGAAAVHFRHNAFLVAYTLMGVLALFAGHDLWTTNQDVIKKLTVVAAGAVLLVGIIHTRHWLREAFIEDSRNRAAGVEEFDARTWVVKSDFWMAYHLGLPLSPQQDARLNELVDVERQSARFSPYNSFHQKTGEYRNSSPEMEPLFIRFATDTLAAHPWHWLKAKAFYTVQLVNSIGGLQVPPPNRRHQLVGQFDINMDARFRGARTMFRTMMGREQALRYHGLIFWTFWPVVLAFVLGTALVVWAHLERVSTLGRLVVTAIPVVAALSLSLPLVLFSSPNDYRYFWGNWYFAVLFCLLILKNYRDGIALLWSRRIR